ncbi:hypothetical protein Tco_0089290 [Tanacetum coccineum]
MAFRNFIYTKGDDDLAFLPKESSSGFRTGSPSASVNTELLKDGEEPKVQPAEVTTGSGESSKASVFVVHPGSVAARINERKCKTRGGELKAASIKCEDAMAEFDQNPAILVLRENISSLTADVKGHKEKARLEAVDASLCREVEELKQDRRDVVSKVISYAALELVHSDELGRLVGTLVSSTITYGRCRAYEQVAAMKEPFDLSKAKGYHTLYKKDHTQASNDFATATFLWLDEFVADSVAPIEALLLKNPPTLQKPAPSRTQMPVPSF